MKIIIPIEVDEFREFTLSGSGHRVVVFELTEKKVIDVAKVLEGVLKKGVPYGSLTISVEEKLEDQD